jgi:dihydromethanopterin reductase (acceptor)
MAKAAGGRVAWVLTGSGHYLKECMEIMKGLPAVDLFLSEAAGEVLKMYGYDLAALRQGMKVFRDNTASAVPVTFLYGGDYQLVVIGPASSNTVAKCVAGISDTLATNIYAQAGKCFWCSREPGALAGVLQVGDAFLVSAQHALDLVAGIAHIAHPYPLACHQLARVRAAMQRFPESERQALIRLGQARVRTQQFFGIGMRAAAIDHGKSR